MTADVEGLARHKARAFSACLFVTHGVHIDAYTL
jgi:hypothetical protein